MEYTVKKCSRRMNVCLNEHKSNFDIVLQIINYVYVLCFVCECVFRFSLYVTHMMMLCTLFFYYLAFHSFGSSFFFCSVFNLFLSRISITISLFPLCISLSVWLSVYFSYVSARTRVLGVCVFYASHHCFVSFYVSVRCGEFVFACVL